MKAKKVLEKLNKLSIKETVLNEKELKRGSIIKSFHSEYKDMGFIIGEVIGEQVDKRDGVSYVTFKALFDIIPESDGTVDVRNMKGRELRAPKNGTETSSGRETSEIELIESNINEAPMPSSAMIQFKQNFKKLEQAVALIGRHLKDLQKNFNDMSGAANTDGSILSSDHIDEVEEYLSDLLANLAIAKDNLNLPEGMHYGTKIRQVEGSQGTRKAKMAIREAKRLVEQLLDPNHPSPNPVADTDKQLLLDSQQNLSSAMTKVSEARVARRAKKNEASDESSPLEKLINILQKTKKLKKEGLGEYSLDMSLEEFTNVLDKNFKGWKKQGRGLWPMKEDGMYYFDLGISKGYSDDESLGGFNPITKALEVM